MYTVGFNQSLIKSAMYEHRCLENIKNLLKNSGKCEDQQHYKAIIQAWMVSTTEGGSSNSPMSPSQYVTVIYPSAIKPPHQLLEKLDVKHKTAVRIFGASK